MDLKMIELTPEYFNKVASQIIVISSLLSGFSIAMIANLLIHERVSRVYNLIFKTTIITAASFLITVFAMTNIVLKTTAGYPLKVTPMTLKISHITGISSFLIGLVALSVLIALSGWTRSKKMGWFTTIIGVITFILIFINM